VPASHNVLILHADQLRYDGLGCNGNPHARTPHIDALAQAGSVFTRHIAVNPVCMPSRASLLTGLYPPGHNVWTNGVALNRCAYADPDGHWEGEAGVDAFQGPMIPEPPTLADAFADAGYDTAAFGKLHLTPWLSPASLGYPESIPLWRSGGMAGWHGPYYGFRHVEMVLGHGETVADVGPYAQWLESEHPDVADHVRSYWDGRRTREPLIPAVSDLYPSVIPSELHNSAWLGERFAAYLERTRAPGKPFFAFVGFPDPHHPFVPSHDVACQFEDAPVLDPADPDGEAVANSPSLQRVPFDIRALSDDQRRRIARYTYAMVHQIDRAVGQIVEALKTGGLWDHTIVVVTSDHGDFLGDHGLLRKSFAACDSLLHVPFVLRAPGVDLPARVDTPMSNCDVWPTLAALVGLRAPSDVHGQDILPIVRQVGTHEAFVYGDNGAPAMTGSGVYDDRYRLAVYPHLGAVELYDHREDPEERHNVADDKRYAQVRSRLVTRLQAHLMQCYHPILNRRGFW